MRYRRYERLFSCLFLFSGFVRYTRKPKDNKNFIFAEYGFRYGKHNGQNESLQGFKGGDFFEWFFQKNTTCPLRIFKRWHERKSPFAEVAEGGFLVSPFSEKKVKVLRVLIFQVVIFPLDPAISWKAFERRRPFSL